MAEKEKKELFAPDFLQIPMEVIAHENTEPNDWLVYGVVYWYHKLKDGVCTAGNASIARIVRCKERSVRNSLENLEKCGFIEREYSDAKRRNRKAIYALIAMGKVGTTVPTRRHNRAEDVGTTVPQSKNEENENSESSSAPSADAKEIAEIIDLFRGVNPAWQKFFARKVQREAVRRLLKQFPAEQLKRIVAWLPKVNGKPYAPTITSPLELEDKMGKLMAYGERVKQGDGKKNNVGIAI